MQNKPEGKEEIWKRPAPKIASAGKEQKKEKETSIRLKEPPAVQYLNARRTCNLDSI